MYKTLPAEIKSIPGMGWFVFAKADVPANSMHDCAGFYLAGFGCWVRSNPFFFRDEEFAERALGLAQPIPEWKCEFPGCKVCK